MAGANRQHHALGIEVLEGEPHHGLRFSHAADDEIHISRAQERQQVAIGPGDDARGGAVRLLVEGPDRLRQHPCRHGRQRTDTNHGGFANALGGVNSLAQRRDAGGGILQEHIAERGQR